MTGRVVDDGSPTGAELIAAERQRQIEVQGWTAEHDSVLDSVAAVLAGEEDAANG